MVMLLDLFCGAGGCGVGYQRAGFQVTGVDLEPQPDYPFKIITADAMALVQDRTFLDRFDVVHASPPCQAYTTMSNRRRGVWPKVITPLRAALATWGGVYVIENVPGARRDLRAPVTLHGGMFGLGVSRPRLFESNAALAALKAPPVANPVAVYGKMDGRRVWTRADGTEQRVARTLEQGRRAMDIDWMSWPELTEAVPPAYTEFLGRQLIDQLRNGDDLGTDNLQHNRAGERANRPVHPVQGGRRARVGAARQDRKPA